MDLSIFSSIDELRVTRDKLKFVIHTVMYESHNKFVQRTMMSMSVMYVLLEFFISAKMSPTLGLSSLFSSRVQTANSPIAIRQVKNACVCDPFVSPFFDIRHPPIFPPQYLHINMREPSIVRYFSNSYACEYFSINFLNSSIFICRTIRDTIAPRDKGRTFS